MTMPRGTGAAIWSAGLLGVLLAGGCKDEPPAVVAVRPVRVMTVGSVKEVESVPYPGRAKATQEVNLSFRVPGRLMELSVKVGDTVEKGQVLARLDPRDYANELKTEQARLDRAKAQLTLATSEYARVSKTFAEDPGAISEVTVDQKLEAKSQAAADVEALTAAVAVATDRLSDTYLRAPYRGVIVARYVENYEDVLAKQQVLRLLDPSQIEMTVHVPENVMAGLQYVESIQVTFDALPGHPVAATIKEVGAEASGTTRTYPVTLIMPQPEGARILPGMTGVARARGRAPEVLAAAAGTDVNVAAVFEGPDGGKYVWVISPDGQTVQRRQVQTGSLTEFGLRVKGLTPGERIVVAGVHYLHEGDRVRILDESPAGGVATGGGPSSETDRSQP